MICTTTTQKWRTITCTVLPGKPGHDPLHLLRCNSEDYGVHVAVACRYVTMFAAAMPAAAAIACAYTFIEMRSDLVKLLFLQRRPVATRATGIGIWAKVIEV